MTTSLLPCPFCGGAPKMSDASPVAGAAIIYCDNDACISPHTTAALRQDAEMQWNARATPAGTAAAWIDFADNGRIRFWTADAARITDDMIRAGRQASRKHGCGAMREIFIAMQNASLRAPDAGESEPIPLADHEEVGRLVLQQPWAVQAAIVTIAAHCVTLKDKYPSGDASDLAGCISQQCLELAEALSQPAPSEARQLMKLPLPEWLGPDTPENRERLQAFIEGRQPTEANAEARLREALEHVRAIISDGALTGFNCRDGDWAERLFASQALTLKALTASGGSEVDWVVRKNGYFYRANARGYTGSVLEAGRWTEAEARKYTENCEGVTAHPASEFVNPSARPHHWEPSPLGHGGQWCVNCKITVMEASVLGCMNACDAQGGRDVAS